MDQKANPNNRHHTVLRNASPFGKHDFLSRSHSLSLVSLSLVMRPLESQAKRLLAQKGLSSPKICLASSQLLQFSPGRPSASVHISKEILRDFWVLLRLKLAFPLHETGLFFLFLYCFELNFAQLMLWSLISVCLKYLPTPFLKKVLFLTCLINRV